MKEKWFGQYFYGESYGGIHQKKDVLFTIEWILTNGEIQGTCVDDEAIVQFDAPVTISGFLEDNAISFIKRYPYQWIIDENGNNILDKDGAPYEIHYSGTFIDDHFEGQWELPVKYKTENGFIQEFVHYGTWTLYKDPVLKFGA